MAVSDKLAGWAGGSQPDARGRRRVAQSVAEGLGLEPGLQGLIGDFREKPKEEVHYGWYGFRHLDSEGS